MNTEQNILARLRSWPTLLTLLLAVVGLGLASANAADLTWNNGASTGNWNTTDANWTGSTWNNGTPDNAIFNNLNATVTLTQPITGGSLTYNNGGTPSGAHELILTGSNLSLGSILSWGGYNATGGGGGVDSIGEAYAQRLRFQNIAVTNSGNATARRGMLYLVGANFNVGGVISDTDAWSVFRSDSSTVTAAGGIDLSVIASQVELYGGTVTTPFVKVGDAAGINGTGGLFMGSGVTLVPTGGSTDYLQVFVNGGASRNSATITGGGMTINTAYAVTNITVLNGSGGLTKTGNGTLTLTAQNNYTGGTTVSGGMLVLASGAWTLNNVGGSGVTVSNNATLRATGIANQLNGLNLNNGTVEGLGGGHGDWGDFFLNNTLTASGTSYLNADIALRGTSVTFDVANSGTLNVGGVLHNGANFGSPGAGGTPSIVVKTGAGTMVLTAANTYSGATTVSNGTLVVNGSLSGSSAVTVWGGALGGSGTIGGAVTVKSGANLLAGMNGAYGTNTLSSTLTLESGAICTLDVGTVYNGSNDRINVTGTVQLNGTALHLKAPSTLANLDTTADYVLLTGSSITGTPTLVWDVQPANGSQFRVVNNGTQVLLRYVPNYLVTYNANGGINPPVDNTDYPSGSTVTVLGAGSMSRVGYTFANWNTVAGGGGTSYSGGSTFTITASTTLYAQWTPNQYTATYLANTGGTISGTSTQTVNYGTSTTSVTATANAGYHFSSWSDGVLTATRSDINFAANFTATASFTSDFIWNNGASTANWNTTDANWTGYVWSSGANAIFNNVSFTVNLTEAISGGSLTANFGGAPSGGHELKLAGNTLSLGSVLVWGGYNPAAGNGGVDNITQAYDQRMAISGMTLNSTGDVSVKRGMFYVLNGATVNVGGMIKNQDAWNVFREDSSTVTATNGIDLSGIASQVELHGGTVTTPFVKVGNAAFNGSGGLYMDSGVTLVPTGGSIDYLQVFNNGDTNSRAAATISSGGMTLNSAYAVTNASVLDGGGGLTKSGTGTLTLTAANTYSGNTVVSNGTLALSGSGSIASTSLSIATNAAFNVSAISGGSYSLPGTLSLSLNKTGAVLSQGQVALGAKTLAYGGTLNVVSNANSDAFASGDSFTLFVTNGTVNQLSGWFSSVTLPGLPSGASGLAWNTNKLRSDGVLEVYTFTTATLAVPTLINTPAVVSALKMGVQASSSRGTPVAIKVSTPPHGTASINAGALTYTPTNGYTGSDTFTVTYSDGHGTQVMTVNVTVNPENTGPQITPANVGGYGSFTASGMMNQGYIIQISTNMPTWTDYTNVTSAANGVIQFTDSVSINAHGGTVFYRLKQ